MNIWTHPELARCCLRGGTPSDVAGLPSGGLARTNPLAPGAYWLDVFAPSLARPEVKNGELVMRAWLAANVDAVKVVKREEHAEGTLTQPSFWSGPAAVAPAPFRYFYVFQVAAPATDFPFVQLGFPTIIKLGTPEEVKPSDVAISSDDTVTKPPPEPLFDFGPVAEVFEKAVWVAGGLAALYIVLKVTD